MTMHDTVQFPCVVLMQFSLEIYLYTLLDKEKRMVFYFGQLIRYYSLIHKVKARHIQIYNKHETQ